MNESLLEKHQFMQQYVLNRALAVTDHKIALKDNYAERGEVLALQALGAWNKIMKECNK